jgi:hypothetical protein
MLGAFFTEILRWLGVKGPTSKFGVFIFRRVTMEYNSIVSLLEGGSLALQPVRFAGLDKSWISAALTYPTAVGRCSQ